LKPKVVTFFLDKEVYRVAAFRQRSVAVTRGGDVYEWGYLQEDRK